MASYYGKHKSEFMTQETVALQYLKLNLADMAASVQVTEEALRKYYEENAARNATPERRRARHILIERGSDDAAAKKKAEAILARAKARRGLRQAGPRELRRPRLEGCRRRTRLGDA